MNNQQTLSIDTLKKEGSQKVLPNPRILSSHDAGWQNMVLEYHRQPAHEMPVANFQQHALVVSVNEYFTECKMDSQFESKNTRRGDLVLIPANMDYWAADITIANADVIVLSIDPQQLLQANQELIKGDAIELIPTFPKSDAFIYGTAIALKQELETNYKGCSLYAESLFNGLAVHLLQKYATSKPQIKEYNGLAPFQLRQVLDLINDSLSEEISLLELAGFLNLSQFHFCREFKKSVGVTPHHYIMQQRVKMAKRVLKQQNLPIAEVAVECGFSNQSHLGRVFKQHTGTTPRRFRNGN